MLVRTFLDQSTEILNINPQKNYRAFSKKGPWAVHLTLGLDIRGISVTIRRERAPR